MVEVLVSQLGGIGRSVFRQCRTETAGRWNSSKKVARVVPVVAGVVDHHVENDPHRWIAGVGGIREVDQVLLRAESGIDIEVVIDVVAVVRLVVILKHR